MSRSALVRRVFLALGALVVVSVVVGAAAAMTLVRRPLPQTDGARTVPGLAAPVRVVRDAHGIPDLTGDSPTDLACAQGYVHAQDAFFTMDLRRHVAAGRLAELVGPRGVASDRVVRTLGWRRSAERDLPSLAPQTRQVLQAYADGVNAYLRGRSAAQVSLDYLLLAGDRSAGDIEPWTPADSTSWLLALAWDLRAGDADELLRARLAATMTPAQIAEVFPAYPAATHPPVLSATEWSPAVTSRPMGSRSAAALDRFAAQAAYAATAGALAAVPQSVGRGDGVGSNAFVVSGARTVSGKPLLAADPHTALTLPGLWYQVGLHCRTVSDACPLDVSGFSVAGMPGVVVGHNATVAWALTNLPADTSDLYLERVRGSQWLHGGRWLPLSTRTETIEVAGGAPVTLTVRSTGHGPLLSDVDPTLYAAGTPVPGVPERPALGAQEQLAVSLAWVGAQPSRAPDALLALAQARDFTSVRAAAAQLTVPAQGLLYADTFGHIGFQAAGRVPLRRPVVPGASPGEWPAPGWDTAYDWTGWVPQEELPSALDPAKGWIVTANQQVSPSVTPYLTSQWDPGYRAARVDAALYLTPRASAADLAALQLDTSDAFGGELARALLAVDLRADPFTRDAQQLLVHWSGRLPGPDDPDAASDGPAAAYMNAVWARLCRLLFDDDLPADAPADGAGRWRLAATRLLADPTSRWWDDAGTDGVVEHRDDVLRRALVEARLDLTAGLGKDPAAWRWSDLHRLTLRREGLDGDAAGGLRSALYERGPRPLGGGPGVVDATAWDASVGFGVTRGPSMRMVVDLADLDASTWVTATGQSDHVLAPTYGSQTAHWAQGEQLPWRFTADAVGAAGESVLVLRPGGAG